MNLGNFFRGPRHLKRKLEEQTAEKHNIGETSVHTPLSEIDPDP
jgi:hypothetical protein